MKVLLDTHTFLWWVTNDAQLSSPVQAILRDRGNQVFFSTASAWEIAIKAQLGKLSLPNLPEPFIHHQLQLNAFEVLPTNLPHSLQIYHLPLLHKDPFDRMLIVQSQLESLPLLTVDSRITQYNVNTIW